MGALRVADVIEDGVDTIVRFTGRVSLPRGKVSVQEIEATGEVILTPMVPVSARRWEDFFKLVGNLDISDGYMAERPMNRLPAERTIFED